MENIDKPKKRYLHPDRVTLSQTSLAKISGWIELAVNQMKGVIITKSNFVEWLIETHGETLTTTECKKIREKFSDEVKFHEWAIREYKKQKKSGLEISFSEFLALNQTAQKMETHDLKLNRERPPRTGKTENAGKRVATDKSLAADTVSAT